MSTVIPMVRV